MSKLLSHRQKLNLTQQELYEKSGISVRTIQRIESGINPTGHTLKALATALGIDESDLLNGEGSTQKDNRKWLKIINLSALPFILFPPLNVLVPLLIMFLKKQFNPLTRQLLTIQLLFTFLAILLLLAVIVLNDWFGVQSKFTMLLPLLWLLANSIIILRNAIEINKDNKLHIKLNFSII